MRTANPGTVLLCGAVLAIVGCSEPAGLGESPPPADATTRASALPADLGTLGGPNSYAADINDAGVVVGTSDVTGGVHAFRWTRKGGMVDLGTLGGSSSSALAINKKGYVLGLSEDSTSNLRIVIWTPHNQLMNLGRPPGTETFDVAGFNDHNTVVGNLSGGEGLPYPLAHIFRWSRATGYVNVDPAGPNQETYVAAIVNDGSLAGTVCCTGASFYGWYLYSRQAEFRTLGAPTGFNGWASGMNAHHQVIGFDEKNAAASDPYPDYWIGPFVWTPRDGFKYLGTLGGWTGYPSDINDRGEIVGVSSSIPFDDQDPLVGFYYSEKLGMVRLPGLDGGLTNTSGINQHGQIAGAAEAAGGNWHAVVWSRPTDRPEVTGVRRATSFRSAGRFGQCLTRPELYRSRTGVGHCLAREGAGPRMPR